LLHRATVYFKLSASKTKKPIWRAKNRKLMKHLKILCFKIHIPMCTKQNSSHFFALEFELPRDIFRFSDFSSNSFQFSPTFNFKNPSDLSYQNLYNPCHFQLLKQKKNKCGVQKSRNKGKVYLFLSLTHFSFTSYLWT